MRKYVALLAVLSGCVTVANFREFTTPEGEKKYFVQCRHIDHLECLAMERQACNGKNYSVVKSESDDEDFIVTCKE